MLPPGHDLTTGLGSPQQWLPILRPAHKAPPLVQKQREVDGGAILSLKAWHWQVVQNQADSLTPLCT